MLCNYRRASFANSVHRLFSRAINFCKKTSSTNNVPCRCMRSDHVVRKSACCDKRVVYQRLIDRGSNRGTIGQTLYTLVYLLLLLLFLLPWSARTVEASHEFSPIFSVFGHHCCNFYRAAWNADAV